MTHLAFRTASDLENQAVELLETHGLLRIPVNPAAVAEAEGLEVFSASLDDDVSGILRNESGIFRIYFNRKHVPTRQRFTVAHELGHYILHREYAEEFVDPELNLYRDDESSQGDSRMEVQANIFAAGLLMPTPLLMEQVAKDRTIDDLAEMFVVSRHAMGHRLAGIL